MSEYIEVTRESVVEICIWKVTCDCGEELEFIVTKDSSEDILIGVGKHICEQEES